MRQPVIRNQARCLQILPQDVFTIRRDGPTGNIKMPVGGGDDGLELQMRASTPCHSPRKTSSVPSG
jgi:hypothetical protein